MRNEGAFITSRRLREILATHPAYRRQWQEQVERAPKELHQAAIAKVIVHYLWESGEKPENVNARIFKDRVARALKGSVVSAETLRWFMEAFGMEENHREDLWGTLFGQTDPDWGVAHTLRNRPLLVKPQRHRTISLFERYFVGPTRSLSWRSTHHAIRAYEDGVDSYFFNHEPWASRIEVVHGGELGEQYEYGNGLTGVDILLTHPLKKMQNATLEYRAHFSPEESSPATEVRRPAFARVENIDMAIKFDVREAPRRVWWCIWEDHIEGKAVWEKECPKHHQYVPFIEEAVVGFRWEW